MSPEASIPQSWSQRLAADLARDKKKTAILTVLVIVGLVVGLRMVFKTRPEKASAGAGGSVKAVVTAEVAAMNNPVLPHVSSPRRTAAGDRKSPWKGVENIQLTRDLFELKAELYDLKKKAGPAPVEDSGPVSEAPRQLSEAELTARVREEAKILCLEMTIVSDTPTAFVNGTVLRAGNTFVVHAPEGTILSVDKKRIADAPAGTDPKKAVLLTFKVVEVTADACVVVKDDVRVTLRMARQGLQ